MSRLLDFAMRDDADYSSLTREQLESILMELRDKRKYQILLQQELNRIKKQYGYCSN